MRIAIVDESAARASVIQEGVAAFDDCEIFIVTERRGLVARIGEIAPDIVVVDRGQDHGAGGACVLRVPGCRPDAALVERLAEPVAVIGSIGKQDTSWGQRWLQRPGADMIVTLAFGEEQSKRTPPPIAHDMELGRQPAPAAPDTSG